VDLYEKYFSTKQIVVPTFVRPKNIINVTPIDAATSAELTMKKLMKSFNGTEAHEFLTHCSQKMVYGLCDAAQVLTVEQADTELWHELRLGRITASRIHQASRCKTMHGSLYESIMGKRGGFSFAMERGINLEDSVFDVVKNEFNGLEKSGLLLNSQYPHLGASPDGIHEDFVLEIKCPYNQNTHASYVDAKKLQKKYMAQIQLQMHLAGKTKALLAVADTNFGRNKRITKVWIDFDEAYTAKLMEDAFEYWISAVYPGLMGKYN
jgi:putative phage-type endonuclease